MISFLAQFRFLTFNDRCPIRLLHEQFRARFVNNTIGTISLVVMCSSRCIYSWSKRVELTEPLEVPSSTVLHFFAPLTKIFRQCIVIHVNKKNGKLRKMGEVGQMWGATYTQLRKELHITHQNTKKSLDCVGSYFSSSGYRLFQIHYR
jgi:hypothetical protein